jgi:hypothetical protein
MIANIWLKMRILLLSAHLRGTSRWPNPEPLICASWAPARHFDGPSSCAQTHSAGFVSCLDVVA